MLRKVKLITPKKYNWTNININPDVVLQLDALIRIYKCQRFGWLDTGFHKAYRLVEFFCKIIQKYLKIKQQRFVWPRLIKNYVRTLEEKDHFNRSSVEVKMIMQLVIVSLTVLARTAKGDMYFSYQNFDGTVIDVFRGTC